MGILKKKRNQNLKTYPSDNFQLLQPWSVPILKTVLPRNVFDSMYELSENVLLNPNSESCGHLLAGEIKTEIDIDLTLLNSYDVNTFFKNILTQFILKCKTQMTVDSTVMNNNYDVNIISMWIVSQKPGEYNPVHYHPYCKVSGVMYLKIPDILPSIKNHKDTDGSILFINTTGTGSPMNNGMFLEYEECDPSRTNTDGDPIPLYGVEGEVGLERVQTHFVIYTTAGS